MPTPTRSCFAIPSTTWRTITVLAAALCLIATSTRRAAAQEWRREEAASQRLAAKVAVRAVTVTQLAELVRAERGNNVILFLYGSACPRSHALIEFALRLVAQTPDPTLAVRAFAIDDRPAELAAFASSVGLPHEPIRLRPWAPGALAAAVRPFGIQLGRTWGTPLVAVIDRAGNLVEQWEASTPELVFSTAQALAKTVAELR